jgi:CDP-glucose 4,6-dehydratase
VEVRQSAVEGLEMKSFWAGKRVLLTGHTGFKGGWLTLWLNHLGAKVLGISLPPQTTPNLFTVAKVGDVCETHFSDIRNFESVHRHVKLFRPEIAFHLAAQPLVRRSYRIPTETFETNVAGTVNVLEAIRQLCEVRVAIMVTTDKVYKNHDWPWPYRETDELGGFDPYSASKAAAEIVIASYRDSFMASQGCAVSSVRAGNVIGGGDWSEDRLIPDAIRAWQSGKPLHIRHPHAIRPWQHVLEPLSGYLKLAEKLWVAPALAGPFNFGPNSDGFATVRDVIDYSRIANGYGDVQYEKTPQGPHEASCLKLDISKAAQTLGFKPKWELEYAISKSIDWYNQVASGKCGQELTVGQITEYENLN